MWPLPLLIDNGDALDTLVAFGPPDEVELPTTAGNAKIVHAASSFWEIVFAFSFTLTSNGTAGNRVPRLDWSNDPSAPFASAASPFNQTATIVSRYSFVADAMQAGAANGPVVVVPIPGVLLTPGESVALSVGGGLAGDSITLGRIRRQRFAPRSYGDLLPGEGA